MFPEKLNKSKDNESTQTLQALETNKDNKNNKNNKECPTCNGNKEIAVGQEVIACPTCQYPKLEGTHV